MLTTQFDDAMFTLFDQIGNQWLTASALEHYVVSHNMTVAAFLSRAVIEQKKSEELTEYSLQELLEFVNGLAKKEGQYRYWNFQIRNNQIYNVVPIVLYRMTGIKKG